NGRPATVSDLIVDLSRRIDTGELKPDLANLDLVRP
ncbi:MAG: hypothetical protein ACI8S3_001027, partial [Alphaproteobacteria bacterium]